MEGRHTSPAHGRMARTRMGRLSCNIPLDKEAPTANIHNVGPPLAAAVRPSAWVDFDAGRLVRFPGPRPSRPRSAAPCCAARLTSPIRATPTRRSASRASSGSASRTSRPTWSRSPATRYVNEMGITTQSCYKGTSIIAFRIREICPTMPRAAAGLQWRRSRACQPGRQPQHPAVHRTITVGDCAGGRTEVQGDMANFLFFMEHLAPAAPRPRSTR